MNPRRTLAQRGFTLPASVPMVGHARFDGRPEWNALALRKVIAEFLDPDGEPYQVSVSSRTCETRDIIDREAERDGFGTGMYCCIGGARIGRSGNSEFFAWLGIPREQIWPQQAHGAAVTLARQPAPQETHGKPTPWQDWKAATRALLGSFWTSLRRAYHNPLAESCCQIVPSRNGKPAA